MPLFRVDSYFKNAEPVCKFLNFQKYYIMFINQRKRPLRKVLNPLNPPDKPGQALKGTFAMLLLVPPHFVPPHTVAVAFRERRPRVAEALVLGLHMKLSPAAEVFGEGLSVGAWLWT